MKALVAGLFLCLGTHLSAQTLAIQTHTLDNGLKILIHEDHDIPNVALYLFFKVGSRNERPGTTGLSHFFEHMMFNGAKKYGPKQFDVEMEKNGGRNNAYTTRDITVYTDWFPRTALPLLMDMEADRVQNLAFDPMMVESERGVVASEREQSVDNSNQGLLYEQLNAISFTAHPYGWPVIGWPSDIASWKMEDLKSHFRMGYAPNNCVMVVAGDLDPKEFIALAEKHFGPLARQEPPPPVTTVEPEQRGERRVTVAKPAQLPLQMVSYHVPRTDHPDTIPLDVLGTILSQGQSSRLYRRMVDGDQIALSVSHFTGTQLDPGQIIFFMQPRAGIDPQRTESVLFEELERMRTAEPSASELQKARNQLLTDLYRGLKTIGGKANLLGSYEIYWGDYAKLFQTASDLEKVTAADVQRVAKKYLTKSNRTVATLVPTKDEDAPVTGAPVSGEVRQ